MARILTTQDTETIVTVQEDQLRLDDPDPDTTYTVALLADKTMRDIRRRHTTKRPNHRGEMIEQTDEAAVGEAIVDYVIRDWSGIMARDADGGLVPVPCTTVAKVGLDPRVRGALVDFATRNQRVEAQAQAASFRAAPDVL